MNILTVGAFVVYLIVMLCIGFYFSNKSNDLSNYYLGGRKMNKWAVALSAQASDMSGWLLMGLPGAVYLNGVSDCWIAVGLATGTYLNWKIVARRLRVYSHACNDSITIPDFFSNRFRDKSGLMRTVAALIILLFFLFYTASGFVACAKLFSATFGGGYRLSLVVGAVIVVSYTLMGGFMAVCWTDVIQGLLMFLAIVLVPAVVVAMSGGFEGTVNGVNAINANLLNVFTNARSGNAISLVGIVSSLVWGLGYFGMPHILVRFMSIKKAGEITESRRIAMSWVTISLAAAVTIGVVGHVFLRGHPGILASADFDPEKIFMYMINGVFTVPVLGDVVIGVMMSAILAAIMSTADSQLLVSASAFSNDIYHRLIHRNAGDRELIAVSRLTVAAVAVLAVVLAMRPDTDFVKGVMKLVSFAWGGFGAAFGPLILLSLFWRRTNIHGAAAGMIVGTVTAILWKFLPSAAYLEAHPGSVLHLYELAPGFLFSFVTIVVVSLLTPPPAKEIREEYDEVRKACA